MYCVRLLMLCKMSSWSIIQNKMATEHDAFVAALDDPQTTQLQQLKTILSTNRDCEYGEKYNFSTIRTAQQYQKQVPTTDYEQLSPSIERMVAGEASVLCQEQVSCFELTGGSSAGPRIIPYTNSALAAMQRALYPWLMDLSTHRTGITRGSSYWSISPALRSPESTAAGVPIGMQNDADYFGVEVAAQLQQLLAVPMSIGHCHELNVWRYLTLRYLISSQDLSLISVWSPSFLLDLLSFLDNNLQRFIDDIASGNISETLPAALKTDALERFQADSILAKRLRMAAPTGVVDPQLLWPQLDTVSCWTQGSSQFFLPELHRRLPGVHLQGKGLLATEGFITLPIESAAAPVLALRSGFYEFSDAGGKIHLCTDLVLGQSYEIILTNYAGLYRYRLGDRVRLDGWLGRTPLLSFIGRAGLVSDLCGEKLSEDFILPRLGDPHGFAMLLPALLPKRRYLLIVDAQQWSSAAANDYAVRVDASLQDNPQYQYARNIGQLSAINAVRVRSPWLHYVDHKHARGSILGDIKPPVLGLDMSLMDYFQSNNLVVDGDYA